MIEWILRKCMQERVVPMFNLHLWSSDDGQDIAGTTTRGDRQS